MRSIFSSIALLAVLTAQGEQLPIARSADDFRAGDAAVFHGGGCRKNSPPGQCCHMQKSTGKVHCH